ncbi:hypothetical protein ASE25_04400 [Terrabacter sp. Root85]|uniref:hypothetical protein n=1 Tax=unclassified Terrabacter TaxID=2630222 RepID=UPI0006F28FB4|nr:MULTISPECIES: hypothetical protein [unclassified Terrabacter]KRC92573.1 hypothetical protein ASE25_04400 [Terrabacter sp. Root85]KRF42518.1 hypothetical protein ASH01_16990 [Terrabacter sp. Soil811]
MGYSTHYLGRLDIRPRLREPEIEWLRAYAELIDPREHGYDVPLNPRAERAERARGSGRGVAPLSDPEILTPWGMCDWVPCVEGCCLHWREVEKSNHAVPWLEHLVGHFLGPDGLARGARADFEDFTFDHVVNGVIAAERGDTRELYLIRAVDNVITTETLVAGDPSGW